MGFQRASAALKKYMELLIVSRASKGTYLIFVISPQTLKRLYIPLITPRNFLVSTINLPGSHGNPSVSLQTTPVRPWYALDLL